MPQLFLVTANHCDPDIQMEPIVSFGFTPTLPKLASVLLHRVADSPVPCDCWFEVDGESVVEVNDLSRYKLLPPVICYSDYARELLNRVGVQLR